MKYKPKEFKKRNPIVLEMIKRGWGSGTHIKTNKILRRNFKQDFKKGNYE